MAKFQRWTEEQGLTLLEGWARDGLTVDQIAHNAGVNPCTLYDWQKRYPEVAEALKKGREVVDYQVENSLLKRALGSEYVEVSTEDGPNGVTRRETTKQLPPNVTAQIFWLKNRRPDKWRRDAQEETGDGSGEGCGVVVLPSVDDG